MSLKKIRQNKVDVVFDFIEIAGSELEKRFGESPTSRDIIRHLTERGLIEPKRIRNYMIIADFDRMLVGNGITFKTKQVKLLIYISLMK